MGVVVRARLIVPAKNLISATHNTKTHPERARAGGRELASAGLSERRRRGDARRRRTHAPPSHASGIFSGMPTLVLPEGAALITCPKSGHASDRAGPGDSVPRSRKAQQDQRQVNGANINENISVAANGSRVLLTRDVGNVTMDLNGIEQIQINAASDRPGQLRAATRVTGRLTRSRSTPPPRHRAATGP